MGRTNTFAEMLDRLKNGDVPSTEEFAKSLDEVQAEIRSGGAKIDVEIASGPEARLLLLQLLKQLEGNELPALITAIEAMRRSLGLPTMLYKQMGDYL